MNRYRAGAIVLACILSSGASAQSMPPCDAPATVSKLEKLFPDSLSDNGQFKSFKNFREIATTDKPPGSYTSTYSSDTVSVKGVKYCEATAVLFKDIKGDYEDTAYIAIVDLWDSSAKTHVYEPTVCARLFYSLDSNCSKQRPAK